MFQLDSLLVACQQQCWHLT